VNAGINAFNFPWLVGIAGLIFLPWTMLMYPIVFPLNGWDWLWIGLAVACDIATYLSAYRVNWALPKNRTINLTFILA